MAKNPDIVPAGRYDSLKWAFCALLVVAGVYGNYYFSDESLLIRVAALLVMAIIVGFVSQTTVKGAALWLLLKDAKTEIRKVVWPTRQETLQTTMVVVVVILVMGLVLWGLDSLLGWAIGSLI